MRLMALAALFLPMLAAPAAAEQAPAAPSPAVAPPLTPENTWHLDLSTGGRVSIQLRPDVAPLSVERIKTLTRRGFYTGLAFHRVIEGFMAQGGDPKGDGTGGSDLPDLKAEFNVLPNMRGTVAMARADNPDSANSQFFIMRQAYPSLDKRYTAWGKVVSGLDVVRALKTGAPASGAVEDPDLMTRVQIAADVPVLERPSVRVLDTRSAAFAALAQSARTTRGADFSMCDIELPVQVYQAQ